MRGLHEEGPRSGLTEDPEFVAYQMLHKDSPDPQQATALALLALVREVRGLRRDISKLKPKAPTMKGK